MTSLEWFVRELLQPINSYRADNQVYNDYQNAQPFFSSFTSPENTAVPAIEEVDAVQVTSTPSLEHAPETQGWMSYMASWVPNPLTYLAPGASVSEAPTTTISEGLSVSSRVYVKAAELVGANIDLKAAKVQEALTFIQEIDKVLYAPLLNNKNNIKGRLSEISSIVSLEISRVKELLLKHQQESGDYDALLAVFETVLKVASTNVLEALCITLKFEQDKNEPAVQDKLAKKNAVPVNTARPSIPEMRELTSFLMRQIMELYIDEARSKEPRLKHVRALPEISATGLIKKNLEAIELMSSINSNYATDNEVLDHMRPVLSSLTSANKDTLEQIGKNDYLQKSFESLSLMLSSVDDIRSKRVNTKMSFVNALKTGL